MNMADAPSESELNLKKNTRTGKMVSLKRKKTSFAVSSSQLMIGPFSVSDFSEGFEAFFIMSAMNMSRYETLENRKGA